MLAYALRRLLATIPVMGVVAVTVFLMLRLAPGDPAAVIAGDTATTAEIEVMRQRLGLDAPLVQQFFAWLWAIVRGDLNTSIFSNKPVATLIVERLEPTVALTLTTLTIAVSVAVSAGVLAASRAGGWIDTAVMVVAVAGFSVPVFVIGYLMVWVFALGLGWLPVQGYVSFAVDPAAAARSLVMPSAALGLAYVALIARVTRAAMLEVLAQDYVRTARAKGVAEGGVVVKHALKNAAIPVVTIIGIGFALLISGVVITETVFNLPGIGRMTIDAIVRRDYPIIQGVTLVFAFVYVLLNLGIDMLYTALDPRIRY
jgi:peptide/nickel transport system permease protein